MNKNTLEVCLNSRSGGEFFDELRVGRYAKISFNKTLRIPEDGKTYPLPAGLGRLPIHRVEDYAQNVPESWIKDGGYFIPLYQSEALFLEFNGPEWHPSIGKVCVGRINAISGKTYSENLSGYDQDYLVIPEQRWLDGINSGEGSVRQFVAMPLGKGYTIEAQINDEETHGGIQILIIDAIDGLFPERDPAIDLIIKKIQYARSQSLFDNHYLSDQEMSLYHSFFGRPVKSRPLPLDPDMRYQPAFAPAEEIAMGIAAGGKIKQIIASDSYGWESWDVSKKCAISVRLVNSLVYEKITGKKPPSSPMTAEDYEDLGIPWFSTYDEPKEKVSPSSIFKRILGISEIAKRRGVNDVRFERGIDISPDKILQIHTPTAEELVKKSRDRAYNYAEKLDWKRSLSEISKTIDLSVRKKASDLALRCCCNFKLGNFTEGDTDGSLALEINPESTDARTWRASCRLSMGDHEGLNEDAIALTNSPETLIFGLEMRAEAAMLSERYQDAINDALKIRKLDINHARAQRILTEAHSKVCQK